MTDTSDWYSKTVIVNAMELPASSLSLSWVHQHTFLLLLLILGGCGGDWWSRGVPDPQGRGVPHQQGRGIPLLRFDAARCLLSHQSMIFLLGSGMNTKTG